MIHKQNKRKVNETNADDANKVGGHCNFLLVFVHSKKIPMFP